MTSQKNMINSPLNIGYKVAVESILRDRQNYPARIPYLIVKQQDK